MSCPGGQWPKDGCLYHGPCVAAVGRLSAGWASHPNSDTSILTGHPIHTCVPVSSPGLQELCSRQTASYVFWVQTLGKAMEGAQKVGPRAPRGAGDSLQDPTSRVSPLRSSASCLCTLSLI